MSSVKRALLLAMVCPLGCRCPADSHQDRPADAAVAAVQSLEPVRLQLIAPVLGEDAVWFEYQLTNLGEQTVFFACAEAACSRPERGPDVPFIEVHEGRLLVVYAYVVPLPAHISSEEYDGLAFKRLDPGFYRGSISMPLPLHSKPPHPGGEFREETIDRDMLDTVRFTLGILPCKDSLDMPAKGGFRWVHAGMDLKCGASRGHVDALQILLSDEKRLLQPGDLPDAGP